MMTRGSAPLKVLVRPVLAFGFALLTLLAPVSLRIKTP
ncbi:hypothetical protein XOC_4083 [Xanthomonas oryzae pv. oryzicola BLS256]|uniref:Uncharacterized protein n=1 Tax=Xanthomonas oryzae pv. oryzicola (strain BLS256) TaxID=383407 RepID=G7TJE1_XANOB|nr:hypothetical protein XOC_4083 [Xanthomonas oryzae pv. oryzicola BLS256]